MDYGTYFSQSESDNMVVQKAQFHKPSNFDDRLNEVIRRIKSLAIKAGTVPLGGNISHLDTSNQYN